MASESADNGVHGTEGGDSPCWQDQVCVECGRVSDEPAATACPSCGHQPDASTAPAARARIRGRDRDEEGRARNARPRDGLGRPLPYEAAGVQRQPEGVERSPEQTLSEAQQLLDDGKPFHAHEVLEDAWKSAAEPQRALWRGMAQLAVGITHAARGNSTGAQSLLRRGAASIRDYADQPPHGIDVAGLVDWAEGLAQGLDNRRDLPDASGIAPVLRG